MADCAADVRAICEALGIEKLVTWGLSGGGPHVLACAALLPDLVTAAPSLCSLAPYDATGLDWMAGFSPAAVAEVRLMFADQAASRRRGRFYDNEGHGLCRHHMGEVHAWLAVRF